jgi:hypothetical protein
MKIKWIDWDWTDFGITFRIYQNAGFSDFILSLDIQITFLSIWIVLLKKEKKI